LVLLSSGVAFIYFFFCGQKPLVLEGSVRSIPGRRVDVFFCPLSAFRLARIVPPFGQKDTLQVLIPSPSRLLPRLGPGRSAPSRGSAPSFSVFLLFFPSPSVPFDTASFRTSFIRSSPDPLHTVEVVSPFSLPFFFL